MKCAKNITTDLMEISHNKIFVKKIIRTKTTKLGIGKVNKVADKTKTKILFFGEF